MNSPAYTPPSAPKACPWKLRGVVRGLLCLYLALCVAFIPLDFRFVGLDLADTPTLEVQRNEAHAFVPVAAGGAAAVAAAIGITETELACGLAVVFAAGAGLYLYYDANTDFTSWPTDQAWPGFKPWDDLTPQEKQNWVGQDGDVGDYWQQQVDLYSLNYGLWDYDQQGNPQPTPEPDDPDDKEKWFTKNNVITALGTGAAVGLGTIASTLVDTAANSLADMLFGSDVANNRGFSIPYVNTVSTAGQNYPLSYWSGGSVQVGNYTFACSSSDWYLDKPSGTQLNAFWFYGVASGNNYSSVPMPGNVIVTANRNAVGAQLTLPAIPQGNSGQAVTIKANGDMGFGSGTATSINSSGGKLNAGFGGTYIFQDYNGVETAQLVNGAPSGSMTMSPNYGQLTDTPDAITNNILNNPSYISNVNNYSNVSNDTKKAAQLPTSFTGPNGTPTYGDYVKTTPIDDITVIPDNEPLPNPNPDNPDNPDNPTNDYQEDFGDEVARLLSQPFDQLFPFCLIGDLRVFTEKVNSAFNGGGMTRSEPNYDELVIPLEQFNVDGLDDITFDLVPIKGMGAIVKPWINALLVVALLIGSFRFFLNRGGE